MNTKQLIESIIKAKGEKLSFSSWVVRECVRQGVYTPIVEKQYEKLLEDISKLPREQRVHFWRKVRFPKVGGKLCRLFEKLEFDLNDSDSGKVDLPR